MRTVPSETTFRNPRLQQIFFFSTPVLLKNLTVGHIWNKKDTYSVITLGSTKVSSIDVVLEAGYPSTAVFIGLLAPDVEIMTAVHTICPKSTRPVVKHRIAVKEGVFGVRFICESCPSGYYFGHKSIALYKRDHTEGICRNEVLFNAHNFSFCSSPEGKCSLCPYGANCSLEGDVVASPNFWGYAEQTGQIIMLRCPNGYCCQSSPCQNMKSCSDNRAGMFCGRCKPGFTEAVFSSHCIQDSNCNNYWFIGVYVGWVVLGFCFMYCFQHLFSLKRKLLKCFCRQYQGNAEKTKRGNWFAQMINWDSRKQIVFAILPELPNSVFLAFFVTVIYFYQDASCLQVKLPASLETTKPKLNDLLLRTSHWSLDTIGFSEYLCVWSGITPVQKVFLKMSVAMPVLFLFMLFFLVTTPLKTSSRKKTLHFSLASGFIVGVLVFYQSMANALFSLVC